MDSQRIRRSNMPRTAGGKRPTAALARLQRERPQRRNRSARLRSRRMRPSLSPTDRTRSLTRALTCALAAYVPQSCGRAAKAAVEEEAAALTSGRAAPLHPRREQWRAKRRGDIIGTILGERGNGRGKTGDALAAIFFSTAPPAPKLMKSECVVVLSILSVI